MKPLIRRPKPPAPPTRPAPWWAVGSDPAWNEARLSVVAAWEARTDTGELDPEVAAQAMAFGHAARRAYPDAHGWDDGIQARLQSDWADVPRDGSHAWSQVARAARHGWESATRARIGG